VGYVAIDSITSSSNGVTDPRIADITITGYPYDFRRGEMTTSGPCSPPGEKVKALLPNQSFHELSNSTGEPLFVFSL
jgi:hypothetical protein